MSWHGASPACACECSTSQKRKKYYNVVVYTLCCREKLHIIYIRTNGLWAVRSCVIAVSDANAVRKHSAKSNGYKNTHTKKNYTPCFSLKRTANNKLHAAQCCWGSQQLHSQSANMEQEGSLPFTQQPSTCSCPEQDESDHVPQSPNLFNIYFNIIHPSTPTSLKWFPFPHAVLPRYTTCISNMFHVANSCLTKYNAK